MSLLALNFPPDGRESTKRTISFLLIPFLTLPGRWGGLAVGEVDAACLREGGLAVPGSIQLCRVVIMLPHNRLGLSAAHLK